MGQHRTAAAQEDQDMTRQQDGQQIGVGYFILRQGLIQVGRLLVITSRTQGTSTEHWDLWSTFRQPSCLNVRQDISFEYQREPIPEAEFKNCISAGSTYIFAQCQKQINP